MGKKQAIEQRKRELTTTLAHNRVVIGAETRKLKQKFNIKGFAKKLITRKPKALFIGSLSAGLLTTLLIRRPKKIVKSKPATKSTLIFSWILALIKPVAKSWLTNKVKVLAAQKMAARQQAEDTRI